MDCLGTLSQALLAEELSDLYEQHAASLIRYATAFAGDAESARDAVQDCFIRYFELRRGGLQVKNPKGWLARVLKNQLIDEGRKGQRQKTTNVDAPARLPWIDASASSGNLELSRLWEQIGTLVSPKELKCLKMRAAGFSYAEIAGALGVQSGTVSVFLSRSREKTGAILQPNRTK